MLAANNFLSAVGRTKGSLSQVNLTANTDLRSVEEFRNLVLRQSGDQLIRLRDVATWCWAPRIMIPRCDLGPERGVHRRLALPNANSLDVIKRCGLEMDALKKELPVGLSSGIAYDATTYIHDAIHEVLKTLIKTLIIVAIVIFLFLARSGRCWCRWWSFRFP